ncbi:MAG: glycoside hydrolase family 2 [Oscillospiraceae bacterium]|nr:glycoside hydrolase family 2 [Oscillospiraceae bacterium]
MNHETIVRGEVPNPAFARRNWRSLNGVWSFAFDPENLFEKRDVNAVPYSEKITVPFCYRAELSGVAADVDCHNVWYERCFEIRPEELAGSVLLHFGAVDYTAKVWVNGVYVGRHDGGHTPFYFDIAHLLHAGGDNRITVKAEDSFSMEVPRGKQMWGAKNELCWYTNTVGIWQSVWLEFTGKNYLTHIRITSDIDRNQAHFEIRARDDSAITVQAILSVGENRLGQMEITPADGRCDLIYTFSEHAAMACLDLYWSPERPVLISARIRLLQDGTEVDCVDTYFGMRKIHREGDRIFLNNQLLYQRLVLDQGYWPDGMMTAPSDDAIRRDIELTKAMGFNGARKHQKIEDPRYYYWADRLGLLVWGELPSAYEFTWRSRSRLETEMHAFIERDFNHPCIVQWVPINESWGVPQVADNQQQRDFLRGLYYSVKADDPTRLVSSNDGWEQIEITDLCGIHDYAVNPDNCARRYEDIYELMRSSVNCRPVYARGVEYNGIPIMLTEMGGVSLRQSAGWGYSDKLGDSDEMVDYLRRLMAAVRGIKEIRGFCYTQLTDVMHETNGLLTPDREPRVPLEVLRSIFG